MTPLGKKGWMPCCAILIVPLFIAPFVLIAILVGVLFSEARKPPMPTEAQLKAHYTTHKDTLRHLIFLCQQDIKRGKVVDVRLNSDNPNRSEEDAYPQLLKTLCVYGDCSVDAKPDAPIEVMLYDKTEVMTTIQVGLHYVPKHRSAKFSSPRRDYYYKEINSEWRMWFYYSH